jgi:hypothetical protein
MASGKSLCLKLVHFLEQVFHKNIFFSSISKDALTSEVFYNNLSEKFHAVFHSEDKEKDFHNTSISYSYTYSDSTFDLSARWNNGKLEWNSEYINGQIDQWRGFFVNGNTPDAARNVRTQIHESLRHDFSDSFPIGAEFIPASRAIAAIADPPDIPDSFLANFIKEDKPFVLNFDDVSDERVNKILRLKTIKINKNKDTNKRSMEVETSDGKTITPLEFSSGQQELIYLLLLISNMHQTTFTYGQTTSIFIEEPSAHLFPHEQKQTIEYIVRIFRELQGIEDSNKARFFISTHSPYVLNVINNMLKKGYLIEKAHDCSNAERKTLMMEEIKKLDFPHLIADEISAHFIQKEVGNMIKESENGIYLYEGIIEKITQKIDDDYNQVRDLLRQFKD